MRKTGFNVFLGIGTALVTLYAGLWWATRPPHDDKPIDWVPIFEAEILPQGCETASRFLMEIYNTIDPDDWNAAFELMEAKGETCFDEKAYLITQRHGIFLEGPAMPVALGAGALADHWPHLTRGDLRTFSQLSKIDTQCIDQYRIFLHRQYFSENFRESPAHIRATLDLYVDGANFTTVSKAEMVEHCRELIVETVRSLAKRNDDGAQDGAIGALRDRYRTLHPPNGKEVIFFDLATTEPRNGSYLAGRIFRKGPLCEEGQNFINTFQHEHLLAEIHSEVFSLFSQPITTEMSWRDETRGKWVNWLIEGYMTGSHYLPQSQNTALLLALFAEEVGVQLGPLADDALKPIPPSKRAYVRWQIQQLLYDEYTKSSFLILEEIFPLPSDKLEDSLTRVYIYMMSFKRDNQGPPEFDMQYRSLSWKSSNRPVSICFKYMYERPKCLETNSTYDEFSDFYADVLWQTENYDWDLDIKDGYDPACLLVTTEEGLSPDTIFMRSLAKIIDPYRAQNSEIN